MAPNASTLFAADLETGIPISVPAATPAQIRYAKMAKGDPIQWFGRGPEPKDWEAQQWVQQFEQDGRKVLTTFHGFAYRMEGGALDEGVALLDWLQAAERRRPGIYRRAHEIAVDFDGIKRALTVLDRRIAKLAEAA